MSTRRGLSLAQFKNTMSIDYSSDDSSCYPKTSSWDESTNCCSWKGVSCDKATGQVVGLDLSCSLLVGSLSPNTSLFRLQGLKRLNLASNDFNGSSIPSGSSQLVSLIHLDLSDSSFSGSVPSDISLPAKLISLDLSQNNHLRFDSHSLAMLIRNLSKLENLFLNSVNMFDVVPTSFNNLPSSLKRLRLEFCDLKGEFPSEIFQLTYLEHVDLSWNSLTGYLPKSNWSSTLKYFKLYNNHFGGSIAASIRNLTKITFLDLSLNEFEGQLPSTLFSLKQLTHLGSSSNRLVGPLPTHVTGLQNLNAFFLNDNLLTGRIPSWPFTLPSLKHLDLNNNSLTGPIDKIQKPNSVQEVYLAYNHMHGEIPSSFFNLANLIELDLSSNNFSGVIKSDMLLKLKNLETLVLSSNNFSGAIKLDVLSKLKNLTMLELSNNKLLSFNSDDGVNSTFQKLETLYFSSCNVQQFPNILRSAKILRYLDLSNNAIKGSIFKWESEGWERLFYLNLSHNLLMSLEQFPGENLHILDLRSNLLQGPLLAPLPPSLEEFWISNNNLTGKIPPSICNLTYPQIVDLSGNYLGGIIPKCLGSSSYGPRIINLQKNNLKGKIPDFCADYNGLINLALNDNQLEGPLPRSLINCTFLKFLNLANNKLNDTFPCWLGALPALQVLILRFNRFHGLLNISEDIKPSFSLLQIVDLSGNEFNGVLPTTFFQNLNSLKHARNLSELFLQESDKEGLTPLYALHFYDQVSVNVTWKKSEMELEYIRTLPIFTAIDFSNNRFSGKIPEAIGELRTLEVLNLSHNSFTGNIPPSLGNLVELESLDLSSNNLSGEIPSEMTKLTFLEVLNFSHNNLVGSIPHGNQFNTFENDSYYGNLGLCGFPLTKQCGNGEGPKPPAPKRKEAKGSPVAFIWKLVMMGYGCGVVLGLSTGYIVFANGRPWWFVRMVERYWKPNVARWICSTRGKRNMH